MRRSRLADRPLASIDNVEAAGIVGLIRQSLEKEMSDYTQAGARRLLGEFAEARDDLDEALVQYKLALDLNPKIGLKRKVQALEAKLES